MKTFAFEQWCDRLQLPTTTRDFLIRLRSSPPARRVQGRLLNVCGTYASRKMGVSIQFESHMVELWAIYTMEHSREVLEFFDQPCQLELHYQGHSVARPVQKTKEIHETGWIASWISMHLVSLLHTKVLI
jgi:putative transposase